MIFVDVDPFNDLLDVDLVQDGVDVDGVDDQRHDVLGQGLGQLLDLAADRVGAHAARMLCDISVIFSSPASAGETSIGYRRAVGADGR